MDVNTVVGRSAELCFPGARRLEQPVHRLLWPSYCDFNFFKFRELTLAYRALSTDGPPQKLDGVDNCLSWYHGSSHVKPSKIYSQTRDPERAKTRRTMTFHSKITERRTTVIRNHSTVLQRGATLASELPNEKERWFSTDMDDHT